MHLPCFRKPAKGAVSLGFLIQPVRLAGHPLATPWHLRHVLLEDAILVADFHFVNLSLPSHI